eukprot:2091216-Rhodomonas_salina.2
MGCRPQVSYSIAFHLRVPHLSATETGVHFTESLISKPESVIAKQSPAISNRRSVSIPANRGAVSSRTATKQSLALPHKTTAVPRALRLDPRIMQALVEI